MVFSINVCSEWEDGQRKVEAAVGRRGFIGVHVESNMPHGKEKWMERVAGKLTQLPFSQ